MMDLRDYIWRKLPLSFLIKVRDKTFSHPVKHRLIRKLLLGPRTRPGYDFFNFMIDKEKAGFIIAYKGTMRALSRDFHRRWPESNIISEDQMDGFELVKYAEDFLDIRK